MSGRRSEQSALVSVGYGNSHLYRCAELLSEDHRLAGLISTGYPPAWLHESRFPPLDRLARRRVYVPESRVDSVWRSELVRQLGLKLDRRTGALGQRAIALSRSMYARAASDSLRARSDAKIYHFRAGFGGTSLQVAKNLGMVTVCDHSIAHPSELERLLEVPAARLSYFREQWRHITDDISAADHVLANSHFVAETCIAAGVPSDRISVAYTVTDSPFLRDLQVRTRKEPTDKDRVSVVYAGTVEYRKGADVLLDIAKVAAERGASFTIVGTWMADAVQYRSNVVGAGAVLLPKMNRTELADFMLQSDVLVLPTRAEGSARVAVEAMSAGMYVVTTREAGLNPASPLTGHSLVPSVTGAAFQHGLAGVLADKARLRSGGLDNRHWSQTSNTEASYMNAVYNAYVAALADRGN